MTLEEKYKLLATHLSYNPDNGIFTWVTAPSKYHARVIGTRAGTQFSDGYRYIKFKRSVVAESRLAWLMVKGYLPDMVDHENLVRSDNHFSNLREATVTDNNRNRTKQSNNTSGYKGVSLHKATGKFAARICVNKQRIPLGYFDTAEEAHQAYIKASEEHHGEFARHA